MAKATALDKVRRVRQRPKPKSQSAPIGPDGPKHPGNRQLYDKRGRPDAGARLYADYPNPKVATFCTALWLTFTLPLTPADATGVLVSRCHHGLAYPEGPRMAHLEHAPSRCLHANTCRSKGGRLLRRGAERGHPQVRLARDHEYRRRISVHVLCLDGPLAPDRRAHLDGSEGPVPPLSSHCFAIRLPGSGQHIHRAAVADAEVRMRLPVCLGNRLVGKDRHPEMDDLLQSPTPTLSPWRQSTCRGL